MKGSTPARMLCSALSAALLAGCSGGGGLTTGSLFGPNKPAEPEQSNVTVVGNTVIQKSDPTSRAMQVATVSARAVKCGYNFDPAKLKAKFLAAESAQGIQPADLAKIEQTYEVSNRGVASAIAANPDYCTKTKTASIKEDLARHLAGDYTPSPRKIETKQEDGGIFADAFGDFDGTSSDVMARKQQEAIGR